MRRVYYRSYDAEVTSEAFIRETGGEPERFAIADIGDVAIKVVERNWWEPWRTKQVWVLQARYQGRVVSLYESREPRVFNMVTRALQRALEERPKPPRPEDTGGTPFRPWG
ncbi:DUF6232 family protein [Actinoplanes subglobosus]|uniref:DUF6232 family protein n=1 Tax=Actinoplanes subglobosus TaxID=1547892 RepID=A0ABV8IU53_9ACTN